MGLYRGRNIWGLSKRQGREDREKTREQQHGPKEGREDTKDQGKTWKTRETRNVQGSREGRGSQDQPGKTREDQ